MIDAPYHVSHLAAYWRHVASTTTGECSARAWFACLRCTAASSILMVDA